MKNVFTGWIVLAAMTAGLLAAEKTAERQPALTDAGQRLEARYTRELEKLTAEIRAALPELNRQKQGAYLKACESEKSAEEAIQAARKKLDEIGTAAALVNHAKGKWIGGAEQGIAKAREMLKKAATPTEREAAHTELAKWEANKQEGIKALSERETVYQRVKGEEPQLTRELKAATERLKQARGETAAALKALGLESVLGSDRLDARLAEYSVRREATPRGLAEFAQQGELQAELIGRLLSDPELMIRMAVADGAADGRYGRAMEIHDAIGRAAGRTDDEVLRRLALAIALEHAVPVARRNAEAPAGAPAAVDPVQRYLHYEKAFLAGELDPAVKELSAWDMRMIVDGDEPDEILAWGRQMLRNYRPDHVDTPDYRWRYVAAVRTDIKYGSQDNQYDRPELQFYQNILMNGGVCGRRAFFGRFILRAFGIPTTARPQRGHAALVHWTPEGWVVCLGGGWGAGWTKTRYKQDLDFLATTQARASTERYMEVKRAQWIGDVMEEKRVFGLLSGEPGFWYGASLYRQRAIIEESKAITLAAVGEDIGEANETREKIELAKVTMTAADRTIAADRHGIITIPATACSKPMHSTGKIIFMNSIPDGKQLHYSRNGSHEDFEYTFDAPKAGQYALTAIVATPSWKQHLLAYANEAEKAVEIELPFTVGMWERTRPVGITLMKGRNVLRFRREGDVKGVSIKEFRLIPAGN